MDLSNVVIDTNVLVSGLRSKRGASYKLISLLGTGPFDIHLSVPLVLEYEEVLLRQRAILGLTQEEVGRFIDDLCNLAKTHKIYFLWRPFLRDAKDEHVLELAVAAGCDYIITYNKRDFEGVEMFGIETIDPKIFLEKIGALP